MSIAYLDPGNIEGDLQAGAVAQYKVNTVYVPIHNIPYSNIVIYCIPYLYFDVSISINVDIGSGYFYYYFCDLNILVFVFIVTLGIVVVYSGWFTCTSK